MKKHVSKQIHTAELIEEKQVESRKVFWVFFSHIFTHQEIAVFT